MSAAAEYEKTVDRVRSEVAAGRAYRECWEQCKIENEKLIKALDFYATSSWRDAALDDRGKLARKILAEVQG